MQKVPKTATCETMPMHWIVPRKSSFLQHPQPVLLSISDVEDQGQLELHGQEDLLLECFLLLLLRNIVPPGVVEASLTKSYQLWPQSLDCPLQLVLRGGVPLVGFVRVAA